MSAPEKLSFETFESTSLEEWKARVEKDLKGKPLEDLQWHLNEEISIDPFYGPESVEKRSPVWTESNWKIGERVTIRDGKSGRERWQEALSNGVEAPILSFRHRPDRKEWMDFWEGYDPTGVFTNLEETYPGKDPLVLLERWIKWLEDAGFDSQKVNGSIDFDPILDWGEPPFSRLADTIRLCEASLPAYRCVQINARMFHGETYAVDHELALALAKTSEYLSQLESFGIDPARIAARLQISVSVGTSYFLEIAKLRALRLLWINLVDAYGIGGTPFPRLMVHLAYESQTNDIYQNMIRSSTQAMSAILGGADLLFVPSPNAALKQRSTPFLRRVARNVLHILRLESHMGKVADPASGSYYIEKLTRVLAEKAWDIFKLIESEGGFMESRSV